MCYTVTDHAGRAYHANATRPYYAAEKVAEDAPAGGVYIHRHDIEHDEPAAVLLPARDLPPPAHCRG